MPSQKKTPPLIQWARPLKTLGPSCSAVSRLGQGAGLSSLSSLCRKAETHKEAPVGDKAQRIGDEAQDQDDAVDNAVAQHENAPGPRGDLACHLSSKGVDAAAAARRGQRQTGLHVVVVVVFVVKGAQPVLFAGALFAGALEAMPVQGAVEGRQRVAAQRLGLGLGALAAVVGHAAVGRCVLAVVSGHGLGRHGDEGATLAAADLAHLVVVTTAAASALEGASHTGQEADHNLRGHDPGGDPANLVVGVVRIQVWRVCVVGDRKEDAAGIGSQKGQLGRQGVARPRKRQHDRFGGLALIAFRRKNEACRGSLEQFPGSQRGPSELVGACWSSPELPGARGKLEGACREPVRSS